MSVIEAISLYGSVNAGVRARILAFLDRLDVPYAFSTYFGTNSAGRRDFARSPHRAVAAEQRLRRLATMTTERTFLSREASPLSRGGIEERLLRSSRHGIYDIDDALHLDVRGPLFERLFSKAEKARRAAAAADVVIVGNDYLAEWASGFATDVRVIPTCVDPEHYEQKRVYEVDDPPRLLWLGTSSGERYLREVAGVLLRLNREIGARLTVIGSAQPILGPLEEITTRVPWSLDLAYRTIADHDIGLMPLADAPYERGKCAYKLLEYGAAALPVVASPIGVNARILAESGNPAPGTSSEWYEALRDLLLAPAAAREVKGQSLRDVVDRGFTFDRWIDAWRSAVAV